MSIIVRTAQHVIMRARRYQSRDSVISPAELEFLAEEERITIISKVSTIERDASGRVGYLSMLAGTVGKLVPNQELNVPLWLAIELRTRNQCQIKVPPWMTLQNLTAVIKAERTDMSTFQPLPFRYIEVAKLMLTHAKEDIGSNYFKLRDLITSIQCLRMNKIIQGIQEVQGPVTITLRNLSAFECNQVRHIFLYGMDNFHSLSSVIKDAEPASTEGGHMESTAPL